MIEFLTIMFVIQIIILSIILSIKYKSILLIIFTISIILSYYGRGVALKLGLVNPRYIGTDESFYMTMLFVSIWVLIFLLSYVLVRSIYKNNKINNINIINNNLEGFRLYGKANLILLLLLAFNIYGLVMIIQSIGLEIIWISRMNALAGFGYLPTIATIYQLVASIYVTAYIILNKRINKIILVHLVLASFLAAAYGSRAAFIEPIIIIIISTILANKISFRKLIPIFVGILVLMISYPVITGRGSFAGIASIFSSTPEFDVLWIMVEREYNERVLTYFSFFQWLLGNKFVDGNSIVTMLFFPNVWAAGAQVRPGAIGESVLNLGWAGGLLIPFLAGIFIGFIDMVLLKQKQFASILIYSLVAILLMKWMRGDEFRIALNLIKIVLALLIAGFGSNYLLNAFWNIKSKFRIRFNR